MLERHLTASPSSSPSRRAQIAFGLVLALVLPLCHLGSIGRRFSGLGPLWGGEILWWVLVAVIILYVRRAEHRPLASIGFRAPGAAGIGIAVAAAIVMVALIGVIFKVLLPALHLSVTQQFNAARNTPILFRLLQVTRAAVAEEITFRGYGFERIEEISGQRWLAAVSTWALFTIAHLSSWGWGQVIIAAAGGLVLTLLYVWRRNLWANMIAHWLTDASAFLAPHS
jgi:membrane protease YdiL (CAAX protease family)